jgi:hypothetical protein
MTKTFCSQKFLQYKRRAGNAAANCDLHGAMALVVGASVATKYRFCAIARVAPLIQPPAAIVKSTRLETGVTSHMRPLDEGRGRTKDSTPVRI